MALLTVSVSAAALWMSASQAAANPETVAAFFEKTGMTAEPLTDAELAALEQETPKSTAPQTPDDVGSEVL